jgi:LuxR family transcriptional regulator, maltose regulon positive regulatory protein
MQVSPILLTKLTRPPVTADRVDRPRLAEMLDRGLCCPLNLVVAAAGFGKSTLVSAWIESLTARDSGAVPAAWLSLDEGDSDPLVFLQYFAAAIRAVYPESCNETLALVEARESPSPLHFVVALTHDIEQLPGQCILVLDDYHNIHGDAVHELLSALFRHWPQNLHLVIISRTIPRLPLASLRGRGQLVEVRSRDLRFTREESAAFLAKVLNTTPSEAMVALLDERLEGWIAGLRLATLSLGAYADTRIDLASLSGNQVEIADYLVDEVLSVQAPEMLWFLLANSILDRFCAELCESVLNGLDRRDDRQRDARADIRWLESNNLFVIPLDNDRTWYRYHRLLQDVLQRRLQVEAKPEQVRALHRAAAIWFEQQSLFDEGLRHALLANDLDLAARLVVRGLRDATNREDRHTLERWLRLLPEDLIECQPWFLIIRAFALQFAWHLPTVWKVLGQVDALIDANGAALPDLAALRGIVAAFRSQEAFTKGQAERALAYCEMALTLLPEVWRYARGAAQMYWAWSMRACGRAGEAEIALAAEYDSLLQKSDAYAVRLLFGLCFNAFETGDLEQAEHLARAMLEQAAPARLVVLIGWAHYFLGATAYYRNDLEVAAAHWEEVVETRYSVHVQAARNSIIGLARVFMAWADHAEACELIELLCQLDMERAGQEDNDARSARAYLQLRLGNGEAAYRWADAFVAPVPDRLLAWLQDPHLAKAHILVERGTDADVQAALDMLAALGEVAERNSQVRLHIEILAVRALGLEKQGKADAALAALRQAVELSQRGGISRVFVDLGPHMRTMLLRLAERGPVAGAVRRIMAAFPQTMETTQAAPRDYAPRTANVELVEPLTVRELEVLALLRERLSNKEIARMLYLASSTVKRHTANLYGKLGVDNRRDAVVKAEALGILLPR